MFFAHLILYVKDQSASTDFYRFVLDKEPTLQVPGMTEFRLGDTCVLGLMPEHSICKLLGSVVPDPSLATGIPRAELYLLVDEPESFLARASVKGAKILSLLEERTWGHAAGYCSDPDGHILAFAREGRSGAHF